MEFTRVADIKRSDFIVNELIRSCPAGSKVLDIGCGNGLITSAIAKAGFTVLGIDSSEKAIGLARQYQAAPNVRFNVSSADQLTADGESFNAVVCSEVLEHLHEPRQLLVTIRQLLRPNGVLIVTVPNGSGPRELLVTRPVQKLQRGNGAAWRMLSRVKGMLGYKGITEQSAADDLTHIHFFTLKSLNELAQSSHFEIHKIVASNFIEQVFPFSFVYKRSETLQRFDCWLADRLPIRLTSGFMSVWKKTQ